MDDGYLHGDGLLAKHLLARMTSEERLVLLMQQPEFQAVEHARRMLWGRIGQAGSEPIMTEDW